MPGAHLYVTWRKPFPGPLTGRSVTSLRAQSAQSRTNGASVDPPTRLRGQSAVRVTWPALVADPPAAAPRPRPTTPRTAAPGPPRSGSGSSCPGGPAGVPGSGRTRVSGRAGYTPLAAASARASASARRARSSPSPGTLHPPVADRKPRAGQPARHVGRGRRRDQRLLGGDGKLGQPVPAAGVELGEHVVEQQHRILAVRAH